MQPVVLGKHVFECWKKSVKFAFVNKISMEKFKPNNGFQPTSKKRMISNEKLLDYVQRIVLKQIEIDFQKNLT